MRQKLEESDVDLAQNALEVCIGTGEAGRMLLAGRELVADKEVGGA